MRLEARFIESAFVALVIASVGCSTQSDDSGRSDGGASSATGGASAAGGSSSTSGGTATSGGNAASGGSATGGGSGDGAGGLTGGTGAGGDPGTGGTGEGGAAGDAGSGGATGGSGGSSAGNAGAGGKGGSAGSAGNAGSGSAGAPGRLVAFYLDVGGSVMATDVVNPRARTIVEDAGQGPDGIALDMEEGHIYWTGMGNPSADDGFIRRSNLDGSNVMTIVPAGGTYTPKQLRIDKENGKLYWSDREGMRVMRSNMDGSMIETLVTTGSTATDRMDNSRWCVGIALDVEGGFVYWSQKGSDNGMVGSLRRAHLQMPQGQNSTNRTDIEVLYSGLPEPIDIDLDLENRLIYWTDRGDDTINRGPIEIPSGSTAANRMDRQILVRGVREAIGVTLDLARGKLYFTGGTGGRVGMANLDGSSPMNLLTGSAGLTGIQVVEMP